MIAWSALIGAWLTGVLGGAHCLAMCGGFMAAVSGTRRDRVPLQPARALVRGQCAYNLGRVATYALLGALAGAAGGAVLGASEWLPVQRTLYVIANLALFGLAWLLVARAEALAAVHRAGVALFAAVQPLMRPLIPHRGIGARFALGVLWGLVPCAMTYAVLPVAMFAGSWWQGALVMLAFGLGTLPNLLAAGWLVARGRGRLDRPAVRVAAAMLLVAFAGVGIWRAFGDPALLAHGPFCLVH